MEKRLDNKVSEKIEFGQRVLIDCVCNLRLGKANEYPNRFLVPEDKLMWSIDYPEYQPNYCNIERSENGCLNPAETDLSKTLYSYVGEIKFVNGYPLNPFGRTGLNGKGLLDMWGPNFAADAIIFRKNPINGRLEMLVIQRKDNGKWAIPGGMVESNEDVDSTLRRELREETGIDLDMTCAREVYRGYVADPRNTDNSWIETVAKYVHLPYEITSKFVLKASDDAKNVKWYPLTDQSVKELYASHGDIVRQAMFLDNR